MEAVTDAKTGKTMYLKGEAGALRVIAGTVDAAGNFTPGVASTGGGGPSLADVLLSDNAGVLFIARDNGTAITYARVDTGAPYTPVAPIVVAGSASSQLPASLGQKASAASLPVVLPSDQTVNVAVPSEQSGYLGTEVVRDVTTYDPAAPGKQAIVFGATGGLGPKWVAVRYRVTSEGNNPRAGNFLKVTLNSLSTYDAAGKMNADSNVFALGDGDGMLFSSDKTTPITRIDIGTDLPKGTETSFVNIIMGF